MKRLFAMIAVAVVATAPSAAAGRSATDLLIRHAMVIDLASGKTIAGGVVLHGKWLDRAALDALLADAKAKAGQQN